MTIQINITDDKVAEFVRRFRSIDKTFIHQYRHYQCEGTFTPEEFRSHLAETLKTDGFEDDITIDEAVSIELYELLRVGSETYAHYLSIRKVLDRFGYGLREDHEADPGTYGNALAGNLKTICNYIEGKYFGPLYNENDYKLRNRADERALEFMGFE